MLKEVRRKIADANDIPLQERECTHTGDCAGTCPYCESEVRYLERELSKRKSLGKAVAVAGIALSAVTMVGCASSDPASTISDNYPPKKGAKTNLNKPLQECDTLQLRGIVREERHEEEESTEFTSPTDSLTDDPYVVVGMVEEDFHGNHNPDEKEFVPKSIEGYEDATFPEEYGTPASWLRSKLTEFNTYIQQPCMDEVKIRFFVESDGRVSSVVIVDYKDEVDMTVGAFYDAVNKAMLSMPHWNPASIKGKPVSALMTINVRDLR